MKKPPQVKPNYETSHKKGEAIFQKSFIKYRDADRGPTRAERQAAAKKKLLNSPSAASKSIRKSDERFEKGDLKKDRSYDKKRAYQIYNSEKEKQEAEAKK